MKLHYHPETDSLYIELTNAVSSETRETADGLNIDFDAPERSSASTSITRGASST